MQYGIWDSKARQLLSMTKTSNKSGYACGEYTYTLVEGGDNPYLVSDPIDAISTLYQSMPWYNSNEDRPTHSMELDPTRYRVVSVDTTVVISSVRHDPLTLIDGQLLSVRDSKCHAKYCAKWKGATPSVGTKLMKSYDGFLIVTYVDGDLVYLDPCEVGVESGGRVIKVDSY